MRTTAYFTGLIDQAAATFRARARSFVIMLSIGMTVLFGTDTIQLAKTLWTSAELRAIAAAQAQAIVAREGANADCPNLIDEPWRVFHQDRLVADSTISGKIRACMDWALFILLKVTRAEHYCRWQYRKDRPSGTTLLKKDGYSSERCRRKCRLLQA